MRIGLAQINPTIGDLEGNVGRCLDAIREASRLGAELVVLPEMAIPGCPPRDILYDPSFVEATQAATRDLAARTTGLVPVVVGTLVPCASQAPHHPGLVNAAVVLAGGEVVATVGKRVLPVHDVYFEPRWFSPGSPSRPLVLAGRKVGLVVHQDLLQAGHPAQPVSELIEAGASLLVCIAASPFWRGGWSARLAAARCVAVPVVVVNACGGNDELVFDGHSFVTDGAGGLWAVLPRCAEVVEIVDLEGAARDQGAAEVGEEEEVFEAIVLGVRDFVRKNRVARAVVGLSGGIDSSVVAAVATEALGPASVIGVTIPSRFTDPRSTEAACSLAKELGIGFERYDLEPWHQLAEQRLGALMDEGTVAENVQARLRMVVLMALVNRHRGMLLNTSNKTELALGYGTLYGDLAGSLSPIGDLTKPEVYALARWYRQRRGVIPGFVLERPPTAELRPHQTDPFDYDELAPRVEELVRSSRSNEALRRSEHKRWQAGVILKLSARSFGVGRMIPITRR
jgi:NAD+ synthase (glutamine-hydrolysing)